MRIIALRTLKQFWKKHPDAEHPLRQWYDDVRRADRGTPQELKSAYATASVVSSDRVVFNIKGNKYRLVVRLNYHYRIMYIRFIGTHTEYDEINVKEI
jgi:mRNA interferase HigB